MKKTQMNQFLVSIFFVCISGQLLAQLSPPTSTRLRTDSAYSPALQRMKRFVVLVPANADSTRRRLPVLYLLHGWAGTYVDWSQRTRLAEYMQQYAASAPMLVVMPDAENSWYVNSVGVAQNRYDDYIARELPALIATRYAADTSRQAIAGLSMGGYGALLFALKYPHRYTVAGSFSGALTMPRDLGARETWSKTPQGTTGSFALPSLYAAFGEDTRNPSREANNLFLLTRRLSERLVTADSNTRARQPYFYLATGIQDPLYGIVAGNRELRDSLYTAGLRYEYHETAGKHTWEYWDGAVRGFLTRLAEMWR
jgi:putative tributyrin esterase